MICQLMETNGCQWMVENNEKIANTRQCFLQFRCSVNSMLFIVNCLSLNDNLEILFFRLWYVN